MECVLHLWSFPGCIPRQMPRLGHTMCTVGKWGDARYTLQNWLWLHSNVRVIRKLQIRQRHPKMGKCPGSQEPLVATTADPEACYVSDNLKQWMIAHNFRTAWNLHRRWNFVRRRLGFTFHGSGGHNGQNPVPVMCESLDNYHMCHRPTTILATVSGMSTTTYCQSMKTNWFLLCLHQKSNNIRKLCAHWNDVSTRTRLRKYTHS